jgi:AraC-like DNA-binding protein/ligand-binding sensor domain-containing protein
MERERRWLFRIILSVILVMLLSVGKVLALSVNDFTFSHIGKSGGLPSQRVFSVCQTSTGAIWWSSLKGVSRYNGSKVRSYRLDEGIPFGRLGGRVIHLTVDSSAIYAFDNRGSVYEFNALSDRFEQMTDISKKLGHEVALNDIYVSGRQLYLALHDGVYLLAEDSLSRVVPDIYVNSIVPMKGGLLFCAREGVFNEQGQRLLPYNTECGHSDEISGRLWLGGYENGLHIVTLNGEGHVTSDAFVRLKGEILHHNPIRSICPYDDETMLIGIDGEGVYQMRRDGSGECTVLFNANESVGGVLHGNGVYSIIVDRWKNIVIGTYSGGIDIARPTGSTTAIYRHVANDSQSLANDHVNTVMPLSGNILLMGTDNGISMLDTRTGAWKHCCEGTVVLDACKKPDGSVLVSTYGKGIYEIDNQARVSHVYTTVNSPLTDEHVYASFYDKNGGLWVGCLNGDLLYKNASGSQYYPVRDVQAVTQLTSGQIAVGTAFGLKLITPEKQEVSDLDYAPSGITDVNPFVNHLLASGAELWIATDGGGVYVYHITRHESRQLTTENGLPSNYVRSLVKARDGRIWIATDEGLSFVSPESPEKIVNVNYCYGLNREYSRGAAQVLPNGDIIFGSSTGAVVIHPESVHSMNYTARLMLLGVNCAVDQASLQDKAVLAQLLEGKLHLAYAQRTFDLLFESVNMRNHFDISYRYKVGQGEWSQPSDQQSIRFVNMEPGSHQLSLQCISRTSGVVIDSKTLTIVIGQPWWNAWWMWCVYVALVLLAFYGAWRVYELQDKYMRLTIDYLQLSQRDAAGTVSEQPEPAVSHEENNDGKDFVDKATRLIVENLSDSEFSIDRLCSEMAMSRTLFYVKLKSYTGKSPQDFIRIIRLERAATLLRSGRSVADAAALTGFDNPKYFSTVFKKYFDVSPSKYQ